jgi:hypothetical protein
MDTNLKTMQGGHKYEFSRYKREFLLLAKMVIIGATLEFASFIPNKMQNTT